MKPANLLMSIFKTAEPKPIFIRTTAAGRLPFAEIDNSERVKNITGRFKCPVQYMEQIWSVVSPLHIKCVAEELEDFLPLSVKNPLVKNFVRKNIVSNKYSSPREEFVTF